jgi:hypothetical protein
MPRVPRLLWRFPPGRWRAERDALVRKLDTERRRLEAEQQVGNQLRGYLSRLALFDGSVTPGAPGWKERWDQHPGRRVLLLVNKDNAGSAYRWGDAVNTFTDYAVRVVALRPHELGYAADLVIPPLAADTVDALRHLADAADIVHVKDENGFYLGTNQLPAGFLASLGKPIVFTLYGSYARKLSQDPRYREQVRAFEGRVALTPDLNYDWLDGALVPQPIDVRRYDSTWQDGRRLAHAPSRPQTKGTDALLEAMQGLDLDFDLITGVTHEESLARIGAATLFFDQAGRGDQHPLGAVGITGWYGNAGVEAAVRGIPTVAHLSEKSFDGAERAGIDARRECAFLNTPVDAEGIRGTIESFLAMSYEERKEL